MQDVWRNEGQVQNKTELYKLVAFHGMGYDSASPGLWASKAKYLENPTCQASRSNIATWISSIKMVNFSWLSVFTPVCICIFKKSGKNLPTIRRTFGLTASNLDIFCYNTYNHRKPWKIWSILFSGKKPTPPRPPTLTNIHPTIHPQDSKTPAYDVIARFKSIYHGRNKKFIEAEKPFVLFCHRKTHP